MHNNYRQAKRLNGHYTRSDQFRPPIVKPQATLPPREAFAGHDEMLEAYDTMTTLNEQIRHHQRAAREASAKATQATADYKDKVKEALAKGEDVTKIKDHTTRYEAEAKAHESFANDAMSQATRHGINLGALMASVAPQTFAASEQVMADKAAEVHAALTSLADAWTEWAQAWNVRRYLSWVTFKGSQLVQFQGEAPMPKQVTEAMQAIEHALREIDRLKDDEAELTGHRQHNKAIEEANARAFGQN